MVVNQASNQPSKQASWIIIPHASAEMTNTTKCWPPQQHSQPQSHPAATLDNDRLLETLFSKSVNETNVVQEQPRLIIPMRSRKRRLRADENPRTHARTPSRRRAGRRRHPAALHFQTRGGRSKQQHFEETPLSRLTGGGGGTSSSSSESSSFPVDRETPARRHQDQLNDSHQSPAG